MQAKQKDVEEDQQKSFVRMKQLYKETKGDKRDMRLKLFTLPYRPAFICSGVKLELLDAIGIHENTGLERKITT
nr:hypothetical protein [Tanacetum cinerariifolium]